MPGIDALVRDQTDIANQSVVPGTDSVNPAATIGGFGNFALAPWLFPPTNWIAYDTHRSIATPAQDGNDYIVLSFVVPIGYDGVIKRLSHNYIGGGFQQGAGGIIWRLKIDDVLVRNYDAMVIEFGTVYAPRVTDGIRIISGQTIAYLVNLPVGGGASGFLPSGGSQIICTVAGWFYPQGVTG